MKKTRMVALVLVAAMMLMGAGYAYWSDTLTINNTVSTGEMKVEFIKANGYPKIFGRTGEAYVQKGLVQADDGKSATITIGNMYPDSYVRYELKMKNTGTIPVVFDNATVAISENQTGFTKKLMTQVFVAKYHTDGTQYKTGESGYWAGKSLGYKPAADLQANLNNILAGCRLEPNEFITFDVPEEYMAEYLQENPDRSPEQCVEILFPGTVGSSANPNEFEKATASFNITLNWKQHNK